MAPKFGTSGLRGLATDLTGDLVARHVRAFLACCDCGQGLCVGADLRASSPRIKADVIAAARAAGYRTVDCGALPTPALALAAARAGYGAVMVTGSHIPADRNGLKFYSRSGEITKADETAIRAGLQTAAPTGLPRGDFAEDPAAGDRFVARYLDAFGPSGLSGRRIGFYAHSAVGRDLFATLLAGMGAEVVPLGRSETFVSVDTEAVDAATRARLADWAETQGLDAIVSTDGDSDRPLMTDETGQIVPGDILGQITAEYLRADHVVTPVSSNSGVTQKGFGHVVLTRIGSPFVIAAMQESTGRVVGYEANGGFLLGFEASGPQGSLPALMTRDCVLPVLAVLLAAQGGPVSARVAREPAVVTAADRLQDIPLALSQRLISSLVDSKDARDAFLSELGVRETALDLTDGVRMHLAQGAVLHIRPSGNAPELRVYVEAKDRPAAQDLLTRTIAVLRTALGS